MKIELEVDEALLRQATLVAARLSSDREHVTRDDVLVLALGSGLNTITIDLLQEMEHAERRENLRNIGR